MKIVLINPSRIYRPGSKGVRVGLPLGLMHIAAVLEKNGYQVKIFDSLISQNTVIAKEDGGLVRHGTKDEDLIRFLEAERPNIIGISNPFTAQIFETIRILRLIKTNFPFIVTVVGGPHISVDGLNFMKENREADIAVLGEGEITILEILNTFKNKEDFNKVNGIIFRNKKNNLIKTKTRKFIRDLDQLPLPAYHLIDMPLYFNFLEQGYGARVRKEKRSFSIITSRGCPFNCVFCSIHLHMGRVWRFHSAQYILNHIDFLVKNYQVKHVSFEDDNLTLNRQRLNQVLDGLIERSYDLTWDTPNGVRVESLLDKNFVAKMKKAGCLELIIGVESGVQEVINKIINKNLKLSEVIVAAQVCRKLRIPLKSFFVIGFPGETINDIKKTIKFALMLRRKYKVEANLMIATPLFGTRLYDICEENNFFVKKPDPESLSVATQARGEGLITTNDFTPEDLKEMDKLLKKGLFKIKLMEMVINPSKFFRYFKKRLTKKIYGAAVAKN